MNKKVNRNKIMPGDKRNISFPLDTDIDLLNYLNSQNNFSGALISLATEAFKNRELKRLESRIENLENIIKKSSGISNTNPSPSDDNFSFNFDATENLKLNPEDEDDLF